MEDGRQVSCFAMAEIRRRQKLKNFSLKIIYLAFVLSVAGFTGCLNPFERPEEVSAFRDKGRIVVSIGSDTNGAQARTIGPDAAKFAKYTLTFSGPEAHDPVDIVGGSSVAVDISPGSWTIGAVGYTGTTGNYTAVAEGSAQVNVSEGETSPVIVVLEPKSTAAGTGTLSYSITVPAGVTGSLVVTTAAGGGVSGGTIPLTAGTANAGTKTLAHGQYLVRVRLGKGGIYAGFTEALHVYAGLTSTLPARTYTDNDFREISVSDQLIESFAGVWYSRDPGIGRLDGYRIGRWKDFDAIMGAAKLSLFPKLQRFTYTSQTGSNVPGNDDFFVFYDDTVYGEQEDGTGGSALSINMGYIGIVRGVNVFSADLNRGAIIIEYLRGCAPQWDDDIKDGQRPFFGIYYKKTDADTVQLANAVDVKAMDSGNKYYTETATLQEAINKNTAENDSAFIVWSVAIPQKREK
jgi:hypothetical protein